MAYYLCFMPTRASLAEMARIAGARWSIEETLQSATGQTGLDQYEVRQYTGWYRHITMAMLPPRLPHRHPRPDGDKKRGHPGGNELIALSLSEIRHLLVLLTWAAPPAPQAVLERSCWRRKHQHRTGEHHYCL